MRTTPHQKLSAAWKRAILVTCVTIGLSTFCVEVTEAQYTEAEQSAACIGDAMHLCANDVPDREKIIAYMEAKHSQLTPWCAVVFNSIGGETTHDRKINEQTSKAALNNHLLEFAVISLSSVTLERSERTHLIRLSINL